MRICLATCVDDELEKTQMFGVKYMPVWAYTLSTYIREIPGSLVFVYDTRIKPKSKTPYADVYLISGINQDYSALEEYRSHLKRTYPTSVVCLGGPIVSSYELSGKLHELEHFDHLFSGDGEDHIRDFVQRVLSGSQQKLVSNHSKFPLSRARLMDFELIRDNVHDYYGGIIEVSRGCPFLCEFCDIRTKPDNNSPNNKSVSLIIQELEEFSRLGVTNVLFACDNFIGNPLWAEEVCDRIVEWRTRSGHNPRLYTWLTINLANHPRLLQKLKTAGFDMFFIGVESFGEAQLLETAKLQNAKIDIVASIKSIQSEGFIVVAGLIFGFDTDPENSVEVALDGILQSGLISGDPSLLTALPGTPLYRRMALGGRLRNGKLGLGGKKYATNIRYLKPADKVIADFNHFVREFNRPQYQYARYTNYLLNLSPSSQERSKGSYVNPWTIVRIALGRPSSLLQLLKRLFVVLNSSEKFVVVIKALVKTLSHPSGSLSYLTFWLFNWSNSIIKYQDLSPGDFDVESVPLSFDRKLIIPEGYETDFFEPIPHSKIRSQRKSTIRALLNLINE